MSGEISKNPVEKVDLAEAMRQLIQHTQRKNPDGCTYDEAAALIAPQFNLSAEEVLRIATTKNPKFYLERCVGLQSQVQNALRDVVGNLSLNA